MKLIIQIPCFNEEKTLPVAIESIPKGIKGIDDIEILIIDDGSTDNTVDVAKKYNAKVISNGKNLGLAKTFIKGIQTSLANGADIIVNTDADNQYNANDIEKIIKPILENQADIVIGARPVNDIKHFSTVKKILQKLGSKIMRIISASPVEDAPSGFRAFSKDAAIQLNIFDNYTYTLETIIQAQAKGLIIKSVPIRVNNELRKSRLISNMFDYIKRSTFTMIRMFLVYRPFRFFASIASIFIILGTILGLRFLYYFTLASGDGHVQSLILSAILIIMGANIGIVAILADLLSINRRLLEDIQTRLKKLENKD